MVTLDMNRAALHAVLAALAREVAARMKEEGYRGRNVTVKVRFSDFETHTRMRSLPSPTDREEEIRRTAIACLDRFVMRKKVRRIGIRVGKLEKRDNGPAPPRCDSVDLP